MEDIIALNDSARSEASKSATAAHSNEAPTPPPAPAEGPSEKAELNKTQRPASSSAATPARPQNHARSASIATSSPSTRRKRLSLSFPVLPPSHTPSSSRHSLPATPAASGASTPLYGAPEVTPQDTMAFLTALAGQERRVLELREELEKAEQELRKMKHQWARHEASRERQGLGLHIIAPRTDSIMGDSLTSPTSREEYTRLQNSARGRPNSNRKVLPGARHQRTLSLLSPKRGNQSQPFPQPDDVSSPPSSSASPPPLQKRHTLMNPPPSRMSSESSSRSGRPQSLDLLGSDRQEAIMQTGKQIADDFKEGLWNFIEDLKQATVGDEVPRATAQLPQERPQKTLRRVSSKNTIASFKASKSGSSSSLRRTGSGLDLESSKTISKGKGKEPASPPTESLIDFGQDDVDSSSGSSFDNNHRWSSSTTLSDVGVNNGLITPPSQTSTARTSTSSTTSQLNFLKHVEQTQQSHLWATFTSTTSSFMSQAQLKKHANALMTQVEKQFTLEEPEGGAAAPATRSVQRRSGGRLDLTSTSPPPS